MGVVFGIGLGVTFVLWGCLAVWWMFQLDRRWRRQDAEALAEFKRVTADRRRAEKD